MLQDLLDIIEKAPKEKQPKLAKKFKRIICRLGLFNVDVNTDNNQVKIIAKKKLPNGHRDFLIEFYWYPPTIRDYLHIDKWLRSFKTVAVNLVHVDTTHVIWDNEKKEVKMPQLDAVIQQYEEKLEKLMENTLLTIPDIQEIIEKNDIVEFDDVAEAVRTFKTLMFLQDLRETIEATYMTVKEIVEGD